MSLTQSGLYHISYGMSHKREPRERLLHAQEAATQERKVVQGSARHASQVACLVCAWFAMLLSNTCTIFYPA